MLTLDLPPERTPNPLGFDDLKHARCVAQSASQGDIIVPPIPGCGPKTFRKRGPRDRHTVCLSSSAPGFGWARAEEADVDRALPIVVGIGPAFAGVGTTSVEIVPNSVGSEIARNRSSFVYTIFRNRAKFGQ